MFIVGAILKKDRFVTRVPMVLTDVPTVNICEFDFITVLYFSGNFLFIITCCPRSLDSFIIFRLLDLDIVESYPRTWLSYSFCIASKKEKNHDVHRT